MDTSNDTCVSIQAQPPSNFSTCSWPIPPGTNSTSSPSTNSSALPQTLTNCCGSHLLAFTDANSGCPLQYCELSSATNNNTVIQCLSAALGNSDVQCYGARSTGKKGGAGRVGGVGRKEAWALLGLVVGGWVWGMGGL